MSIPLSRTLACLVACVALGTAAAQQAYPSRPLTIVVPFGPGSAPDAVSRLVGEELTRQLGQPVVIQNKPGANSMIGTAYVAQNVPADGYTLLYGTNSGLSAAPSMVKSLSYDPLHDLAPVASLQETYFLLVARPGGNTGGFADLLERIRRNPGKVRIGGASLTMEVTDTLMRNAGGLEHIYVPYKQLSRMLLDIEGGQIEAGFSTISSALPLIQSGKLTALAATSPQRLDLLPEVPAMAETLPGVTLATWTGFFVRAGTPADYIDHLHRAINDALKTPKLAQLTAESGRALRLTPAEFRDFIEVDEVRWREIFQAAGIEPR
mgnify:CR=1 FL=1